LWVWLTAPTQIVEKPTKAVSIFIVFKNEEKCLPDLLKSLARQQYPPQLLEIIFVDDASSDTSLYLVQNFQQNSPFTVKIFQLNRLPHQVSAKKEAITQYLDKCTSQIILTTDADCTFPETWVATMAAAFTSNQVHLVAGPVLMAPAVNMFSIFQLVDFLSLQAVGAGLILWQKPTLLSAANMAYRKSSFFAVKGYEGNTHISSGDDQYLLFKIRDTFKNSVYFCKNSAAIVSTLPQNSFSGLINQKVRWAGKWAMQSHWTDAAFTLFVFLVQCAKLYSIYGFLNKDFYSITNIWFIFEYVFLAIFLRFYTNSVSLLHIFWCQLVYPIYVIFMAVISLKKGFWWKGKYYKQ
jgi:poly-beta-1,6-N-acetyl-D-glucosamine synthase